MGTKTFEDEVQHSILNSSKSRGIQEEKTLQINIAKLSHSLRFSWAEVVFILNFTPPTPPRGK